MKEGLLVDKLRNLLDMKIPDFPVASLMYTYFLLHCNAPAIVLLPSAELI